MKEDMNYKYVTVKKKNQAFFKKKNKTIRQILV